LWNSFQRSHVSTNESGTSKRNICFAFVFRQKNEDTLSKILSEVIFVSETTIEEQQPAPDFTLPAIGSDNVVKNGQVQLSALRGHTIVLYFYPKDDTPGCTAEACSFRDANREMQKRGVVVLGVSADDIASHQKFAQKYGLPYPLLADTDTTVSQLYGVWKEKNYYGKKYIGVNRETFLIDKEGIVRKVWPKVNAAEHAQEVLEAIESLGL
jgi:thioredoxin-dependent peroxiredoxin